MDNQTAKEILSAYRPNGADADDSLFQEALAHCRHDPEMQKWLEEERRFDRAMLDAMEEVHPPREGLRSILATLPLDRKETKPRRSTSLRRILPWVGGMAASVILAFFFLTRDPSPSITPLADSAFSMPHLVEQSMPLDFKTRDISQMIHWLERHGAPVPLNLPSSLLAKRAAGCRIFSDDQGHLISLLCFEHAGEAIHIFVFSEGTAPLLENLPLQEWWEEENWNFHLTRQDNQHIAIASQLSREQLTHLL